VLVEAGGLAFLFGAGEGAAASLQARGLVRADVDLVLLPDLGSRFSRRDCRALRVRRG
jgi:hypothetical protein